MIKLSNQHFNIVIDDKKGFVSGIYNSTRSTKTNYILSPEMFRDMGLPQTSWFGNVQIRYRTMTDVEWRLANTGMFCDSLTTNFDADANKVLFTYKPGSRSRHGIRHFVVKQSFAVPKSGDTFEWKVTLENLNPFAIEMGELSFPAPFNSSVVNMNVDEMYSKRVLPHFFIAGHSSYVFVEGFDGKKPCLLMVPDDNTPLELFAQPDEKSFQDLRIVCGGIKRLYVHSTAAKEVHGWKEWFHGHSSVTLKPYGKLTYGFTLKWVDNYREAHELLRRLGKVTFRIVPGMVLPEDTTAKLLIKSRRKIKQIIAPSASVRKSGKDIYSVKLKGTGLRRIKVLYGKDQWSALVFNSIPAVEDLIKARSRFIVAKQQVKTPDSDKYGAFLMWDAEDKKMVTKGPAPYFAGGSDELGFADPLFLSAKNARFPNRKEIAALETYIDNFLFGKLQDKADFGVVLWYGDEAWRHYKGSDKVRSFNYPHVFNIYYSMYLIGKYYNLTSARGPLEYLTMAYHTARAMYDLKMIAGDSYTIGNMGTSMLLRLLQALESEGMLKEREELLQRMQKSAKRFVETKHPYGSEFSYDTTGLETVYFFRKYVADKPRLAEDTLKTILALRHRDPMWCKSGNDVRCGMGNGKAGNARGGDEICFSYMAPLNGLCVLDSFVETGDPELLETGYAGIVGCWSLVDKDGTGHNLYTHEPDGMFNDAWTGEMGLALFASIESMGSYVVDDPDFGPIGYGCDVKISAGKMRIVPTNGLRRRIIDKINGISVVVPNGIIEDMTVFGGCRVVLSVSSIVKGQPGLLVDVRRHGTGSMRIRLEGKEQRIRETDKNRLIIEMPAKRHELELQID